MTNEQAWKWPEDHQYGPGEWADEPDKIQWVDEATDLDCLIVRNRMGALCGYVGLPPEHPWHGVGYDDDRISVDVHGGLTFSNTCHENAPEGKGICHIPLPGRTPDVWWLGFDCGHYCDITPSFIKHGFEFGGFGTYRNVAYVRNEVQSLAEQLKEVA